MALVLNDRVKETTTTTGTGALTLAGAVTGFETFGTGVGNSNTTYYAVTLPGTAEFEVGLGTLSSDSSTIARTTVISSSNSDNAVNFSAGTKTIFCTLPASKTVFLDGSGNATLGADLSVGDDLTVEGGVISFRSNSGSPASLRMYCEVSNAHFQTLQPQPHAASAANTLRLPNSGDSGTQDLVAVDITQTLTNKTLTSPKINEDVAVTSTATEINKLDGVTATTTELNYVDVTTLGTVEASKAVTADANGDVSFSDNDKAKFGTGNDLQIYHEPTFNNSIIQESGSGNLLIGGSQINFREATLSTTLANFSTAVDLYHNGSKKFETTSDGATVTGTLAATLSTAAQTNITSLGTLTGLTTSGNIELGHANDTTIARASAGVVTIEGNTIITTGNSDTPSTTTSSSDADFVLVDDGGTMKKITPSNLGITSGGASKGFAVAMAIAL